MTKDNLFDILKEEKNIKIKINIKNNIISLHKLSDIYYRISINNVNKYVTNNIVEIIELFLSELAILKTSKIS